MIPLPRLKLSDDRTQGTLTDDYTVSIWPITVTIGAGFSFDGASIPRLAQPFIGGPWDARRLPAATVHDWLYASHVLPRWLADLLFLRVLLANGHGLSCSLVDWWAVRRFGRAAWDSHNVDEQCAARGLGHFRFFTNHKK